MQYPRLFACCSDRAQAVALCIFSALPMAVHHDRMSVQELAKLEAMMRKGKTAPEALRALQNTRAREGRTGPSLSGIRFLCSDRA